MALSLSLFLTSIAAPTTALLGLKQILPWGRLQQVGEKGSGRIVGVRLLLERQRKGKGGSLLVFQPRQAVLKYEPDPFIQPQLADLMIAQVYFQPAPGYYLRHPASSSDQS